MSHGPGLDALEAEGLVGSLGGVEIIHNVSFRLPQRGLKLLIGPNGAGKTTLFRMLTGLLRPQSGSIKIFGVRVDRLPPHARHRYGMAIALQLPMLLLASSVEDNLALASSRSVRTLTGVGLFNTHTQAAIHNEVLRRIGLLSKRSRPVASLTHAERKWLEVGCALVQNPRILLMDEPTAGLSETHLGTMVALVKELCEFIAVLVIEHRQRFLQEVGGDVSVLNEGRLIFQGTFGQCQNNSLVKRVYYGNDLLGGNGSSDPMPRDLRGV